MTLDFFYNMFKLFVIFPILLAGITLVQAGIIIAIVKFYEYLFPMRKTLTPEEVLDYVMHYGGKYLAMEDLVAHFSNISDEYHYTNVQEAINEAIAKGYLIYTKEKGLAL